MSSTELQISHIEGQPPVGLAMTGAAFDAAQRDDVLRIEPNLPGMFEIAHEIGVVDDSRAMPPLLIVARDASPQRATIGRWDSRLPQYSSEPTTGRYFPASELSTDMARSCNREALVRFAEYAGARALTEITIWGWAEEHRRAHAAAFATGLLLGQRPLDLLPKPGFGSRLLGAVNDAFTNDATKRIEAVKYHQPPLPEPFIITYRRPQLPPAPNDQPIWPGTPADSSGPEKLTARPLEIEVSSQELFVPPLDMPQPAFVGSLTARAPLHGVEEWRE